MLVGVCLTVVAGAALASVSSPARAASCPWLNTSKSPAERAREVVRAMTLDDKIAMVHQPDPIWTHYGVAGYIPPNPRLCIPDLMLNDAGQGVGDQEINTTAYPSAIAQASSWDRSLQRAFGRALGFEAWHKGVNVQLAPDINIARFPMNGRNSEAFGEDPYFTGQTAVAEIQGIQENPVIATVKHYALNNHEVNRMTVSSDVDERTLREIYTPAFEASVRHGHAGSVMCSYNRIHSIYACENRAMLTGILKKRLRFDGFVMSDWGGTHSTVKAAKAGLDMEMGVAPGRYFGSALKSAVQSGAVPVSRLNDMVLRILRPMFRLGIFEHPHAPEPQAYSANVETPDHIALARKVSEEGTVLLKNRRGVLPIQGTGKRIAVIGDAGGPHGTALSYNTGGSAHIPEAGTKADVVNPFQGIQQRGTADTDVVTYTDGSSMADAAAAATAADVAVVFANDAESEGNDRPDLYLSNAQNCTLVGCAKLPQNQDQLIETVAQANPNTVVVLDTGGPMLMPWLAKVKGVLQAWFPGQEDGNAIAALLFGDVNPSGKLPQTFPKSMADLPVKTKSQYPGVNDKNGIPHAVYSEKLRVGYRWYDAMRIRPLFPFGFGLSYTTFAIRHLSLKPAGHNATGATVRFDVANTGHRAGAEVPQVYVGFPASTGEPPKQLKAYARAFLAPGKSRSVALGLNRRSFAHWSLAAHGWRVSPGCYRVMVGNSSRAIARQAVIAVGAHCANARAHIPAGRARVSHQQGEDRR